MDREGYNSTSLKMISLEQRAPTLLLETYLSEDSSLNCAHLIVQSLLSEVDETKILRNSDCVTASETCSVTHHMLALLDLHIVAAGTTSAS